VTKCQYPRRFSKLVNGKRYSCFRCLAWGFPCSLVLRISGLLGISISHLCSQAYAILHITGKNPFAACDAGIVVVGVSVDRT
jgi:hypothetical protein